MPCTVEPTWEERHAAENAWRDKANAATRAACDMVTEIRRIYPALFQYLSLETKGWIAKHDKEDAARLKKEFEKKIQADLKLRALSKLSQDERRALGV